MARRIFESGYGGATLTERVERLEEVSELLLAGEGDTRPTSDNALPARLNFCASTVATGSSDWPWFVAAPSGGPAPTDPQRYSTYQPLNKHRLAGAEANSLAYKAGTNACSQFYLPDVATAPLGFGAEDSRPVDGYWDSVELKFEISAEWTADNCKWGRGWDCRVLIIEDHDQYNTLVAGLTPEANILFRAADVLRCPGTDVTNIFGQAGKVAALPMWSYDSVTQPIKSPIRAPRKDTDQAPVPYSHARAFANASVMDSPWADGVGSSFSVMAVGTNTGGAPPGYGPNMSDITVTDFQPAQGAWIPAYPPNTPWEYISTSSPRKFRVIKDMVLSLPPPPKECLQWELSFLDGGAGGLKSGFREVTLGVPPAEYTVAQFGSYNNLGVQAGPMKIWAAPSGGLDLFRRYHVETRIPLRTYQKWITAARTDFVQSDNTPLTVLNKRLKVLIIPGPCRYMEAANGSMVDTWSVSGGQVNGDGRLDVPRVSRVNPDIKMVCLGAVLYNRKVATIGEVLANPNQLVQDSYAANDSVPGRTFDEERKWAAPRVGADARVDVAPAKRLRPPA